MRKERALKEGQKRKGVVRANNNTRWRVKLRIKGELVDLGSWTTEEEAIGWSIYYENLIKEENLL